MSTSFEQGSLQTPQSAGTESAPKSGESAPPVQQAMLQRKIQRRLQRKEAGPPTAAQAVTGTAVTRANVNVRKSAAIAADNILGVATKGTSLHVTGSQTVGGAGWYQVEFQGATGFVTASDKLVGFTPAPAAPAASSPAPAAPGAPAAPAEGGGIVESVSHALHSLKESASELLDEAVSFFGFGGAQAAPAHPQAGGGGGGNTTSSTTTTTTTTNTTTNTTPTPTPPANGDVFSAEDAKAVQDNWAKGSSTSKDTGTVAIQFPFKDWKGKAAKAVAAAKKKGTLDDKGAADINTWIGTLDAHEQWKALGTGTEPADPGAVPETVKTVCGDPAASLPGYGKVTQYDVSMPGGEKYSYKDQVQTAYTINDQGVGSAGKVGGKDKIADVFSKAGVSSPDPATVTKVFSILSSLEGKFDAINTYDTGYVSVGFIQFISGKSGSGSLASVLRDMKKKSPDEFATHFHAVGLDVDAKGLVVVDPSTGNVLHGEAAVGVLVSDKRFAAAFQNAGAKSEGFQQAQARIAYAQYYAPDLSFSVSLKVKDASDPKKKVTVSGNYSEVLKSEAGKVASVDRCVQRGKGSVDKVMQTTCQAIADKHSLANPTAEELAKYEAEIVPSMKNRYEVLGDANLTQPAAVPAS